MSKDSPQRAPGREVAAPPAARSQQASPAAVSGSGSDPGEFGRLLESFRARLETALADWLADKRRSVAAESPARSELLSVLTEYLFRGGKRLRPALVYYTYRACRGGEEGLVLPLSMAVELLHTYLLIHDDIMDRAELRRGEPAAQVVYRDLHGSRGWSGSGEHFGESAAILLGDLSESYAVELFASMVGRTEGDGVRRCFSAMCQEVIIGQYLELTAGFRQQLSERDLLQILRMKSGCYSVERPVQLGALAAGATASELEALSRYGSQLGEAFQLQDDLLGVFGDTEAVGKPVGGDLAEGKHTLLIHHTLERLSARDREIVHGALGNDNLTAAEAERVRGLIESSGARELIGEMIAKRMEAARVAIADLQLEREGALFLSGLIEYLMGRDR